MKDTIGGSDASFYYHASSALETAIIESSAEWGNLADAMRNATVIIPATLVLESIETFPLQLKDAPISPISIEWRVE